MCLILLAYKQHPKYKLIIAANRDEFYQRKTKPADFWVDHPQVLGGRDLEAGGTWMGMNTSGELSLLTNFRDLKNIRPDAPSRGHLVSDFLTNDAHAKNYLEQVAEKGKDYNGFNILCGTVDELFYYGNYQEGVHPVREGIHGLSNALLNTPWPKIVKGKKRLSQTIARQDVGFEDLFTTLYDDIKVPIEQLPDTGVGIEKEEMLSPIFIKSPNYGSRCSTVMLVDHNNKITYAERTYDVNDFSFEDRVFEVAM